MIINIFYNIAKKEILDNIRNKWIILITVLFTILTLLVSYGGSYFSEGWQDLGLTVAGMMVIVQIFISIIGLMLGYAAIVGEIERGSMNSLLSLPTKRGEILIGKFLGLGAVLTFTILVGFGIGGIIIGINVPDVNYVEYLAFIGSSILIGLVFLSIGLFLSCLFMKRSTAMGGAIFVWFLFNPLIWGFIMAGVFLASGLLNNLGSLSLPDWYFAIQLINPLSIYSTLVSLNVVSVTAGQEDFGAFAYPSFYTSELMITLLILWIIVFFLLAFLMFRRRDI